MKNNKVRIFLPFQRKLTVMWAEQCERERSERRNLRISQTELAARMQSIHDKTSRDMLVRQLIANKSEGGSWAKFLSTADANGLRIVSINDLNF